MFIKTTKANGYEYIKLVESFRDGGSTKHKVLYNFGRADMIKNDESFLRIVRRLCEIAELPLSGNHNDSDGKDIFDDCNEAELFNYGYLAYLKLWQELDIEACLERVQHFSKVTFSVPNTVFLMAIQHLLNPRSKLSTFSHQGQYFNMSQIPLHHMYRTLDRLADNKEQIESGLFEHNYVRIHKEVDVVFYDVTTISFESVVADELRNFGYSKECKFNEVQVVMGMIIDSYGIPVGYELFPGNTFDGKTMVEALKNIKNRFGINRVIIVADRGINSKGNLKLIKEAGYGYIMASKIRGMSAAMQKRILNTDDFILTREKSVEAGFKYKVISHENTFTDENNEKHTLAENLIISFSPKRAKKDAADRARLVAKAEKLLEHPEKISAGDKRGGKKYLNKADPKKAETWTLAIEKIKKDAEFDGYYGIQSSEKELTALEVIDAYKMLWKIEESFRIMKTTLEVQPVFHWTEKRIRGHFVVCFLAFLMERKMERLFCDDSENKDNPSPNNIREALLSMQLVSVSAGGSEMYIKAKPTSLAKQIFRKLKIPMPSNINTKDDLHSLYLSQDMSESMQQLMLY